MEFDLHVHTSEGSACSRMPIRNLIKAAREQGLDGVCITDHDYIWEQGILNRLGQEYGILVFGGLELSTSLGEILIYGVAESLIHLRDKPHLLRTAVQSLGGVMVAAHPFRRDYSLPHGLSREECGLAPLNPKTLAEREVFRFVDSIEVYNGRSSSAEKTMAIQVAGELNIAGTGGSDAHSVLGVGGCVTVFQHPVKNQADFLNLLHSGQYRPAKRDLKERKNWVKS